MKAEEAKMRQSLRRKTYLDGNMSERNGGRLFAGKERSLSFLLKNPMD